MSAPAAVPQFVGAGSAAEQSVEDRWYMREHGSPAPVDSSPFGWFIRMLHFHPPGGVRNRLSGLILSLRRIVGGRSPHPPKAAAGIPLRPPRVRRAGVRPRRVTCQAGDGAAKAMSVPS